MRCKFIEVGATAIESEMARSFGKGIGGKVGISGGIPPNIEMGCFKIIPILFRKRAPGKIWGPIHKTWPFLLIDDRPTIVGPLDRVQGGLSSQNTEAVRFKIYGIGRNRSSTEVQYPPGSIGGLYKFPVTTALQRRLWIVLFQDGIMGVVFIGTIQRAGSTGPYLVTITGTTFGSEEIVPSIFFQQVRPFGNPSS